METALSYEAFAEQVLESELGRVWADNQLLKQDIWSLTDLGYTEEECAISNRKNIYFERFYLPWLKLLAKLTIKDRIRSRHSLGQVSTTALIFCHLDEFLRVHGYTLPQDLTNTVLQQFIAERNGLRRTSILVHALQLWAEEGWLKVQFVPSRFKSQSPKIEIIPEEVLHEVYEHFDLFPPMLERLFRLQLVLACRIGEMLRMPRHCLKQEHQQWFLLRWIEKLKQWRFLRIHPQVAELIQEQQRFLDVQLGSNSDFKKLFCWLSVNCNQTASKRNRFEVEPFYRPDSLKFPLVNGWLKTFSEAVDLRDKQGNRFVLKSHMFRRTRASIMAYCETEDEYIAAVLGHASMDMLPHYRKRSLERLEREAQTKGYVDMYGRVTTFKPKQRRYEKLAELLKISTPLGECHRPTMLGDCQYRYACLSCDHHRVTLEDRPQLEADCKRLQQDLEQAEATGQQRRITEIRRLLELLNSRLKGLNELQSFSQKYSYD